MSPCLLPPSFLLQVPDADPRRVRGHRLQPGVLPPRADVQEQAAAALAVGGVQGARQEVQEEPQEPLPRAPHQLHQGRVELLQAHHQVRNEEEEERPQATECIRVSFNSFKVDILERENVVISALRSRSEVSCLLPLHRIVHTVFPCALILVGREASCSYPFVFVPAAVFSLGGISRIASLN